jgi:DNA ligase (NAD+)
MSKSEAKERIAKLKTEINHHRYLYHVLDKQEISDAALDSLKHELWKIEQAWPDLITPDSPTQRVAGKPLAGFNKFKHPKPILSIEDAFSLIEIKDWQERNEKLLGEKINGYFGELKMDGLAMVLTYERGLLIKAATRGNGLIGEEVTSNIRTIESVPLVLEKIKYNLPDLLEIRGEIVITKRELERINKEQIKRGLPTFANPRNLAAGSIRQLDPKVTATRRMEFYAFELLTEVGQSTHQEVHSILHDLGFKTSAHSRELANLEAIEKYLKIWETKRNSLPYQTDGVVLVVNSVPQEKLLGSIGKADRWMLAYKFPAEQATTRVLDIVVQVGRTGVLTPVAVLEPVLVAGSTVSRATLHNQDEVERLDVRIGDTVIIQKAGDVIPDVVQTLPKLRTGKEKPFHLPNICPVCGSKVVRHPDEVAFYCSNSKCFAVAREKIYHFVSRAAFDFDGLGPKIIDQLLNSGLIKDAADLFNLTEGDLEPLERFAEKSAQNLITAVSARKKITLPRFINSLGIRHVGEETAELLANKFGNLNFLMKTEINKFEGIAGIGPVVARSLVDFFAQADNKKFINKLLNAGVKIATPSETKGQLANQTFVFTGTLNKLTRGQAKEYVRKLGGKTSETVSQNTNYVVVGDNPGSKNNQAKKLSLKILSEDEFCQLVGL